MHRDSILLIECLFDEPEKGGSQMGIDLIATHPEGDAAQRFGGIPGVRFTEGVVFAFDGPNASGPETAGGVMVLQGTVADPDRAQVFWARAAELSQLAQVSPGFIRFIGFADGLSSYAVGFWCTAEEAVSFAQGRAHRDAVAEQERDRNLYSQFAGVWTAHTIRPRTFYCECRQATRAPADTCEGCGATIADVFQMQTAVV